MKKHITLSRIIGITLLFIAILMYYNGSSGLLMGLSGIALLFAPTKYVTRIFSQFIISLSNWKALLHVALYDGLYLLFLFLLFGGLNSYITNKARTVIGSTVLDSAQLNNPLIAAQSASNLSLLFSTLVFAGIIALILSFIAYVFARSAAWSVIAHQKITAAFIKRFAAANFFWWLIWGVLVILLVIGMGKSPFAKTSLAILFIISTYFTIIMQSLLMKTHAIGYSISNGLGFGLSKLHLLVVPYALAFVAWTIIYQPLRFIQYTSFAQPAAVFVVIIYLAWLRIFLYSIINEKEFQS